MPERPPPVGAVTALEVLDSVPGLRLASRDWRSLASMRHPVKVALWLAMLRPVEELEARAADRAEVAAVDGEEGYTERRSIPAVVAWAEAAVLKGIKGDMTAWSLVADRIEGKVGSRLGEEDPEDARRRVDIQSTIEAVVAGLTNARLENPSEEPLDITPVDTSMDTERQDSDTARQSEIAEAAHRETQDNQERGQGLVRTNDSPEERDLTDPNAVTYDEHGQQTGGPWQGQDRR
jgi:hypothetical protein